VGKLALCQRMVHLDGRLISFQERPYLPAIYHWHERNLVLRCSRQTEKSTFLANTIITAACTSPGIKMLLVCPRYEQGRVFCRSRLFPMIEQSPLVRRMLIGDRGNRLQVAHTVFRSGAELYVRAAYRSADACRGVSADLLMVDEFQDTAAGDLPVLQETLSHSAQGRTILTGTPKLLENHLEGVFRQSTACEWHVPCARCRHDAVLDERVLGPHGPVCPACRAPIDPRQGRWVPRNPTATWGAGFWVNHLMVPWIDYPEILERQRVYDPARFKNEVLGLPTSLGDHVVTRAELEACCTKAPMAATLQAIPAAARQSLVAGVDWGGGGTSRTVVTLGFMDEQYVFHVLRFERFAAREEPSAVINGVARMFQTFRVSAIAADGGGNGHVFNRLLLERLGAIPPCYAISYSTVEQEPRQDGALWQWTVNRSASIGALFARIKKRAIRFPRAADCGSYLDEIACEIAQYDDVNRAVKYTHPAGQQDDALHALNFALLLGIAAYNSARSW
jgi:hypothetical protein